MRFLSASVLIAILGFSADAQVAADLIIVNASVQTMAAKRSKAEAIAVIGNKIAAVGTNAEIRKLVGERTRVINADGRLVLPGFNDSHVHFMSIGNLFSTLNLQEIKPAEEMLSRLAHYTKFLPKGRWILGSGGSDDLWKQIDGEKLDEMTPHNPVFLYNADARSALANSLAINAAGVRATKPGIVSGPQFERIRHAVPADHGKRWFEIAETASKYAASFGITSVQDTDSDDHAAVYRELARQGKLKVRVYDCHGLPSWKKYADAGLKAATGDAMVRRGCLKGTADVDEKGKAALQRDVIAADKAGMQVLLHALGPAMNKVALDVFENAAKANGKRDRRFRIEHAERAAPADIPRFASLSVITSMQPHLFGWEGTDGSYYRSMLRSEVTIAFGSDATMSEIDPMLGIYAAKNGAKLTDTINAYTTGSAYAEFQEDLKGTIEVGKLADLVILRGGSLDLSLERRGRSHISFTIVDGKVVFQAD